MKMEKLLIMTMFLQTCIVVFAETTPQQPSKPVEIPLVIEGSDQPLDKGRSLDLVPILCSFCNGVFSFEFSQSLGNVSITIINESSNIIETQESEDSNVGYIECLVPVEQALYSISVVDENGTIYYAEFNNNLAN